MYRPYSVSLMDISMTRQSMPAAADSRVQCELPKSVLVTLLASGLLTAQQIRCLNLQSADLLERSILESCYRPLPVTKDAASRR